MKQKSLANVDNKEATARTGGTHSLWMRMQVALAIALVAVLGFGYGAAYATTGDSEGSGDGTMPNASFSEYIPDGAYVGNEKLFFPAITTDNTMVSSAAFDGLAMTDATAACYKQDLATGALGPGVRVAPQGSSAVQVRTAYYFNLKDKVTDEVVGRAFCIQPFVNNNAQEPSYCTGDGTNISARLAWLLVNYPPLEHSMTATNPTLGTGAPGCDGGSGLECSVFIQNVARQLAVWSETEVKAVPQFPDISNVFQTDPVQGPAYDAAIQNVYNAILASIPAQLPGTYTDSGEVTLVIDPETATNTLPGGEAHNFTVTLKKGVTPLAGEVVTVTTDFGVLNQLSAVTDANGQASFVVSSNSAGTANLEAFATVVVPVATNYVHETNAARQQTATGDTEEVEVNATATKIWEQPTIEFNLNKKLFRYWNSSTDNVPYEIPDGTTFMVSISKQDAGGVFQPYDEVMISQAQATPITLDPGTYKFCESASELPPGYALTYGLGSSEEGCFVWSTGDNPEFTYENVITYDLKVKKKSETTKAKPGETVKYTYKVTNAGPASVKPEIADNLCPNVKYVSGDSDSDGYVDPNETWHYACDYKIPVTQQCSTNIVNTVTVDDAANPKAPNETWTRGGDTDPTNNQDDWTVEVKCKTTAQCKDVMHKMYASNINVSHDGKTASATVKNNSSVWVDIGLASYRKFDEVFGNQEIFDWKTVQIGPGQTVNLVVKLPFNLDKSRAAAQLDLFCGPLIKSLNGELYGERKFKWLHINGKNYATPLPIPESCPGTVTGFEGISANDAVTGKLKVKALYTGQPLGVRFDLYNASGQKVTSVTENTAPYCFQGDDGSSCYDWNTDDLQKGDYILKATALGLYGESLKVACNTVDVPFKTGTRTKSKYHEKDRDKYHDKYKDKYHDKWYDKDRDKDRDWDRDKDRDKDYGWDHDKDNHDSSPKAPSGKKQGLNYKYYEGSWSKVPSFDSHSKKSGTVTNFSLSPKKRSSHFGFKFYGYIWIGKAGSYTFYTTSDDGSKLYIDGDKVVDNDGLHGAQERSGTKTLSAGWHSIEVRFFEREGDEVLKVDYKGPDTNNSKKSIPNNVLYR